MRIRVTAARSGGTVFAEAQAILRRQGGPVAGQAEELIERIAADTDADAEFVRRKVHLSLEGADAETLAELAVGAVTAAPDEQLITRLAPLAHAALQGASIEAFLAAQRDRIGRHHGTLGHVWGGARGGAKKGQS